MLTTSLAAGYRARSRKAARLELVLERPTTVDDKERPPMVVAFEWVGKITGIGLEMVLPGILGHWLDERWGTGFLALVGFALGLTVAIWHLLRITGNENRPRDDRPNSKKSDGPP